MPEDAQEVWKKRAGLVVGYSIVVAGVVTAIWLMLRNEPFREPMLAYGLRIFLTLAAGVAGGVIPGTFTGSLEDPNTGWKLQTTGAIGFAAFTYFTAPFVAPNLDPANIQQLAPEVFPCRVWMANQYVVEGAFESTERPQTKRVYWVNWVVTHLSRLDALEHLLRKTTRRPVVIAETTSLRSPYRAFNAVVRISVPAAKPESEAGSHSVLGFLVHGDDSRKTFTPLVSTFSPSVKGQVLHVPETRGGDFLFLILWLNPAGKISATTGESISVQLFRL